jgi:hypothetical protein
VSAGRYQEILDDARRGYRSLAQLAGYVKDDQGELLVVDLLRALGRIELAAEQGLDLAREAAANPGAVG